MQTMDLLACAFEKADYATAFDNSGRKPRAVAVKVGDDLEYPIEADDIGWVAEKLTTPYLHRLSSRKLLGLIGSTLKDGRTVRPAEAAHGKDYTGLVIRATEYHVLQDVAGELLLHDRQLTATTAYVEGQEQTISYRYKHGKIVPVDAALTTARPQTPKQG